MGLDVLSIVTFSLVVTVVVALAPKASGRNIVFITVLRLLHRLFLAVLTLAEALKWQTGTSTVLLKDWLQEEMGYILYLPILVVELFCASLEVFGEIKRSSYVVPPLRQILLRAAPDAVFWGSALYLFSAIVRNN